MGRARRPHLPGVPFHLVARLQGKAPLFLGLEPVVARSIREQVDRSGGQLLAYAIMPNHLHIVYAQGRWPLAAFMQPLLRRLALRVHARDGTEGHVFERRFRASPCRDPDYLRNAILYVHLNSVRARLCSGAEQYAWTTHHEYCARPASSSDWDGQPGSMVRLFAPAVGCSVAEAVSNYRAFLDWRVRMDAAAIALQTRCDVLVPTVPAYLGGDVFWAERFATCALTQPAARERPPLLDLRDLARRTLRDNAPDLPLESLRSGRRSKVIVAVRRDFILRAKENGHRNRSIARFLNISDVAVSYTR